MQKPAKTPPPLILKGIDGLQYQSTQVTNRSVAKLSRPTGQCAGNTNTCDRQNGDLNYYNKKTSKTYPVVTRYKLSIARKNFILT